MPRKMTVYALSAILVLYTYSEPYASPLALPVDIEALDIEQPVFPEGKKIEPNQKVEPSQKPVAAATTSTAKAQKATTPATTAKAQQPTPSRPYFSKGSRQQAKLKSPAATANRRWRQIQRIYVNRTKRPLIATSRKRTPSDQARVTRQNIRRYGVRYVLNLYRNGPAIREIVRAWRVNRKSMRKAQAAMTEVITAQVNRGVFVSDHLRGVAVDVRTRGRNGARMGILRDVAQQVGATVYKEVDHAHIKLV